MKKELDYFMIGASLGGCQDWFDDRMMRLGGCGAVVACDSCIYFDLYKNTDGLYPFDKNNITKEDYVRFAMIMKPYLSPRMTGIDSTDIYMDGFADYLRDTGANCRIIQRSFDGGRDADEGKAVVRDRIDSGFPLPCLTLRHKNAAMDFYVWHWYMLAGYEETPSGMNVKAVTYGESRWLDFDILWNTGYRRRGGLVLYDIL